VIDLPQVVLDRARAEGTEWWIESLPDVVASLCREWRITVGATLVGGTQAYVCEADLADGTPAVLKLTCAEEIGREIAVMHHAGGDGAAAVHESDVERGALLLERLGPKLDDLGLPIGERLVILCEVAQRFWRPAAGLGLPTGAEKGRFLIDHITATWEQLDRPCAERTVEHAIATAERRIAAHDDERAVLVHGDHHQWNTLQTLDGNGYKVVDPDGLFAEPAYDLGIVMREDPDDGDLEERATTLAALTGVDRTAIWEWGIVERVSTGLAGLAIGMEASRRMLVAADRIAAAG
jgi:streptomycin 6-kinase